MKPEEFNAALQGILKNPTDQAALSTELTRLYEGFTEEYTGRENAETSIKTLTEVNEKLRAANLQLFTRLGAEKSEPETKPETPDEPDANKLSFEALFDEKGGLK